MSEETGAQLLVQSADGINDLRMLARMLMENLANEERVRVDDMEKVPARGGEAYGFGFTVASEVRGRVAVVRPGDHAAPAIASGPGGPPPGSIRGVDLSL